ncbi:MAG: acyl-CoA thioesterase [Acidimicrobiia bacterium]
MTAGSEWASATTLVELLTLEEIDTNLYRARNPAEWPRPSLFGGQVAAQALRAAAATVSDDRVPHSIHGYFLRPGSLDRPTLLEVDRDRDGRSFSSRHVNAVQQGEVIFSALASFHVDEEGPDHHVPEFPVDAGDPEAGPVRERGGHNVLLDVRMAPGGGDPDFGGTRFWARPRVEIPDDAVTRACVLTYLSDLGWAFGSVDAARGYGGPSLDHTIWLQRPIDANDWMFVDLQPVTLAAARGVFTGTIHDRAGTLAAYFAQESLLRKRG